MRLSNWSEKLEHNKWLLKYQNLDWWCSVGQTWVRWGFELFFFFLGRFASAPEKDKKYFLKKHFFWIFFFRTQVRACEQALICQKMFEKKIFWKTFWEFFFPLTCVLCTCTLKRFKNIFWKNIFFNFLF